jgi:integrase
MMEQLHTNFIESLKSEATKRQYKKGLEKYMAFYKFESLDQILADAEKPKLIESQIINYIVSLKQNDKIAAASIRVYLAAILHFYLMNDIILNKRKITMYIGESVRKQKDRAYTTQEIQRLLEFCDERAKAIVLLLCSTGVRIGAIPDLQLKHLRPTLEKGIYQLIIYEGTKDEYYTFCTPEAAKAVDNYLDYRQRCGEKLNENSPLLREQFDINDQFAIRYPKKMKLRTMQHLLEERLNRSGVMPSGKLIEGDRHGIKRNPVARSHGFRKFATTNMIRAKLNPEAREMLLGHSIGLSNAYYRPDESEVLAEYMKAVDLLTINEENKLRREVETLKVEKSKIDELALEISRLKESLQL